MKDEGNILRWIIRNLLTDSQLDVKIPGRGITIRQWLRDRDYEEA